MTDQATPEGAAGMRIVARNLARVPVELRKALRPKMRDAGEAVKDDAAARASWSTQIPRSLELALSFKDGMPAVILSANASKARHARVFEGIVSKTFRHPVFEVEGRRTVWVAQAARPYLLPAAREGYEVVSAAVASAVDDALVTSGFR